MAVSIKKGRIGPGRIGTQIWMLKNLDVDTYRNGDPIPEVQVGDWASISTGAWCYYEDNPAEGEVYGKLYNWHAVTDPRGLAPVGWHIPSNTEISVLRTFIGNIGGPLKATGTNYWSSPNTGATNLYKFNALPGGIRLSSSNTNKTLNAYFWTTTERDVSIAEAYQLNHNSNAFPNPGFSKGNGLSVRLIKD